MFRKLLKTLKGLYTFKSSIHFIYSDKYRDYGSTVLRGKQLSQIARKALSPTKVYYTSTDYNYENCVLFLTKWSIFSLSIKEMEKLKENGNVLILDPIDANLLLERVRYADIIIAVSETIYDLYRKRYIASKRIVVVDHNVDLRLKNIDWKQKPTIFRTGYFGEVINAVLTPAIRQLVDVVWVNNVEQNNYWLKELPKYSFHYAIRRKREVYPNKPFMKGFVAAHCGANILIQDSEKEAVKWLGEDYPYLLRGKVTDEKVIEMLKYAEKTYGSKIWEKGLEKMREIKEKTSEEAIGKQLVKLFSEARMTLKT